MCTFVMRWKCITSLITWGCCFSTTIIAQMRGATKLSIVLVEVRMLIVSAILVSNALLYLLAILWPFWMQQRTPCV